MVHLICNADKAEPDFRVTEKAKDAVTNSCRRSLLPQRASARQSSMGVQPMKRANPSDHAMVGSMKEIPSESRPFQNVGKMSVSSIDQNQKQIPSQGGIRVNLPKNLGQSTALRKGKPEDGLSQGGFQRIPFTAPVSHLAGPIKTAIPHSNSFMKPATQSKPQPSSKAMPNQTKRSTSEASSQSSVSCISTETAKNKDGCGEGTSDHAICISEPLPRQRGKGILGKGQSSNSHMTKIAPSSLKVNISAKIPNKQKSIKNQRPPFTTLQQHFSPKKSWEAPTTSFSAQPKANAYITPVEISQFQTELMQLHLLHESAAEVLMQWQQSADQSMETHFASFCKLHYNFQHNVQKNQASINQSALLTWCEDTSNVEFAQNVQLLSRNILELYKLSDSGGKYVSILKRFESWFTGANYLRDSRKFAHALPQDLAFIEGIEDDWKADIAILEKKLAICSRQLRSIRKPQENSTLGHVLSIFQTMIVNFMDELDVIRRIEKDVVAQEILWIDHQVEDLFHTVKYDADLSALAPNLGVWNDSLEC